MNKNYLISSLLALTFFTGCETTNALNNFKSEIQSAYAIENTKKRDLYYNNEIKAILFVTYLNNINKKYKSDDINSFLIGVHLTNNENNDLNKDTYSFSLNNQKATSINKIDTNSNLVQSIPLKNNWAKYYLIDFKNDEDKKDLNLKFSHINFGHLTITLQK
ncbi:MAG: hypothetical protein GY932_06735 [Arcobacter sp.]|nr:hypothetical protein [Arcobacter sp.]